jgi:AcrR family transcriptional regulator
MPKGRRPGKPDTKAEILEAARVEFAAGGYHGTSLRTIAARAGVDPSLVIHYFGSREQLFIDSLDLPVNPAEVLQPVLASGTDNLGVNLVTGLLASWDEAGDANQLVAVLRSATEDSPIHTTVSEFVHSTLVDVLSERLGGPEATLRAALITSQLLGLLMGRYVLRLRPLVDASVETLAALVGPVVDQYAIGELKNPE